MSTAEVKVLDGGFSTQLATHVGDRIDGDPLWTSRFLATDPDAVYRTHLDFLRAGSDIIETNTYQASVADFVKHLGKTELESVELIKTAVVQARRAVNDYISCSINEVKRDQSAVQIAGSIGPYAACLHDCSEYTGTSYNCVSMDAIAEWHKSRLETLVANGIDLLAIETIPSAREAEMLVDLLKQYPNVQAWLSFSCRQDGKSIADGSDFKETVLKCYRAGNGQIIACGVNCLAPRAVTALLKSISENEISQFIPLVAYPNSGEKYSSKTFTWTIDDDFHPPEEFVKEWLDLGVRYIGGCCRTGAKEITRISNQVKSWLKSR